MTINDWWRDRPEERYWMIAPSRGIVGDALMAPVASDDRRFEWSHELVGFTEPGDTLFVWDRTLPVPGIGAWGRILGPLSQTEAPRRGEHMLQWRMPISDTLRLASPITLPALRRIGDEIVAIRDDVEALTDGPVYFPFIGSADTLAPAPAYIAKIPRDLVALLSSRFGFEFAL
ncbi:hypothetical protein [Microbacterium thalassium]|uniref:Uncharacterized protein n=1 Tax=Microbacterium thalassium TaxID=362649 RepID=A0A7X0KV64_9MICO|nr:hypothetical protein [Microbacterium thalassium]MBB6391905.1 hypothetical protein [Microbacterium thalassium]GLK23925.1 hypothetical protein GCM10017607_12430 [Microbacterium thalassium]